MVDKDERVTEQEVSIIEEKLKGTDFTINDFYITKNASNKIILVIKYTSLLAKTLDKIEDLNFEYYDDYIDVVVKRKGFNNPTRWRVYYERYKSLGGFWDTHFDFMIRKTAISQALRILFADYLYQINYTVYGEGEYLDNNYSFEKNGDTSEKMLSDKIKKFDFDIIEKIRKSE